MGAGAGVSGVGVGAGSSKAPRVVRATPPPPCTHHEAHLTKMRALCGRRRCSSN